MRYQAMAAAILLSGCAITTDTIAVNYKPLLDAAPLPGAQSVAVNLDMLDRRTGDPAQVGSKKNGYGMEMASIVADRPVTAIFQDAIRSELQKRGFRIEPSGKVITVEVIRLRNDFLTGFWSGDAKAEATMAIQVKAPSGAILFSRTISGEGLEPGIQLMTGPNAERALEKALADAIDKLFADRDFISALLPAPLS